MRKPGLSRKILTTTLMAKTLHILLLMDARSGDLPYNQTAFCLLLFMGTCSCLIGEALGIHD